MADGDISCNVSFDSSFWFVEQQKDYPLNIRGGLNCLVSDQILNFGSIRFGSDGLGYTAEIEGRFWPSTIETLLNIDSKKLIVIKRYYVTIPLSYSKIDDRL